MVAPGHNAAGQDRIPNISFRLMSFSIRIRDWIRPPGGLLTGVGIGTGMTVVDYGCGPGSYVRDASGLAGANGTVYAVDVHELAVKAVSRRVREEGLANVIPVLATGYASGLPDAAADLVYALDMFHMVDDPGAFLAELRRIVKPEGILALGDGHQPRAKTRRAVRESGLWTIEEETVEYLRCRPLRTAG
ncbi:class I SAM-dependent methyltransferase [Methanoculleus sp. Wushi-C6]|uniref:Class I SAM-dependent methyltransferase n=1 Tax=Methanoculleus caldifontis TaxID=2651577 RepID=A0ABU3WZS9_9EURY|nr:class I SAM-dependent methyltransferase [Methanoculleus sp. Wushi-C6]MDV2481300.1 class I SAM-dependent methyltransferase [Methanoculleus sp. Wushi-C6]